MPYSRNEATDFVRDMAKASMIPAAGQWIQIAVELKSTGEMIGDVALHVTSDDDCQGKIGYTLARSFWGCGYAHEAVSALLSEFVFHTQKLNLHRMVAECDVENIASWKLLEKLGFRREAHFVESIFFKGKYGSEYHYGILGKEWRGRHA